MDIDKFKQSRIEGREQLLKKIIDTFKSFSPVAIYQFGSGKTGFKDEFSDIDIWITFRDDQIENILKNLNNIFRNIAPVIVVHHSKSWSPVGGSANSIIHETKFGLFIVDYYISKLSETVIKKDFVMLYGDDLLTRGEWSLNKEVNKEIHDSHSLKKDINLFITLIFISIKCIVRKWKDDDFINSLRMVHKNFRKRYNGKIKRRQITLTFKSDYRLLSDLYHISNKDQRRAISKIIKFIKQVEVLYI